MPSAPRSAMATAMWPLNCPHSTHKAGPWCCWTTWPARAARWRWRRGCCYRRARDRGVWLWPTRCLRAVGCRGCMKPGWGRCGARTASRTRATPWPWPGRWPPRCSPSFAPENPGLGLRQCAIASDAAPAQRFNEYRNGPTMLLDATESQLVLVDYQERLMPAIFEGPAVLANARRLAEVARMLDVPVWGTEQNPSRLGANDAALRALCQKTLAKM